MRYTVIECLPEESNPTIELVIMMGVRDWKILEKSKEWVAFQKTVDTLKNKHSLKKHPNCQ